MNTANSGEDSYERLANALEALPGGFARTESGVEMELLKMAFSPEEAWLAGQMTRTPETPAESRNGSASRWRRSLSCSTA